MKPMRNLRKLSRKQLECVLLNENFIDCGMEIINPKVLYTVLNKIQNVNGIKL